MQIENFDDLVVLLEGNRLTNEQVFEVVQNTMGLILSNEQQNAPREELIPSLKEHYNKYFTKGQEYVPLFLDLDLSVI